MKRLQTDRQANYSPLKRKNFTYVLTAELMKHIPSLGCLTANALARHLETLFEEYYPPTERVRMGQIMWPAVAKEETHGFGKRIETMRLKPVLLDVVTGDDIEQLVQGARKTEVNKQAAVRLFDQAHAQGGVLSCVDAGAILNLAPSSISKLVRRVEAEEKRSVPRRGTVHDIGPSVTHKRQICYQIVVLGKSVEDTARDTRHSPESVTRYVQDYRRVYQCLRAGFSLEQTAYATKLPRDLVAQYDKLQREFTPAYCPWEPLE
jgi:hypothetical protein